MSTKAPEFEQESFNMVLLGNLNPAIFHPEWFVRVGLMGESFSNEAIIKGVTPRLTIFESGGITVECNQDRMTVQVADMAQAARLFKLVPGILRLLPHTPMGAVGTNHQVKVPVATNDEWLNIGHNLAPKKGTWDTICEDPRTMQLMIKSEIQWRHKLVEHLNLQPDSGGRRRLVLSANYHLEFLDDKEDVVDVVEMFLAEFSSKLIRRSRDVADMIFKTSIANAR